MPDAFRVALVDVVVSQVTPLPTIKVAPGSRVEPLPPCQTSDLLRVTELCSGMGAMTSELSRLGFQVPLGVDQNIRWQRLFEANHQQQQTHFMESDAGSTMTLRQMYDMHLVNGVVAPGVSCQPYSRMGDERGMQDSRASSLGEVLRTSWAAQATVVLLECVAPVLHHDDFQAVLKSFCHQTGYGLSQKVLDLQSTFHH